MPYIWEWDVHKYTIFPVTYSLIELKFDSTSIYPINSKPYGYSYAEWTCKWWQWLLSIPKQFSPAFDLNGKNANINQEYTNVFFLCQTYEDVKSVPKRTIQIPKNKSIFMPIINWISILHIDGENEKELLEKATHRMDVVGEMVISMNEITFKSPLQKFRIISPFFDVDLPKGNIIGVEPGKRLAISDGYWIFLKPLLTGVDLNSYGSCSSGITKIGVNYNITLV